MKAVSFATHLLKSKLAVFWQLPSFVNDYFVFKEANTNDGRFSPTLSQLYPCLSDKTSLTPFEPHYIYHPAWAARVLKKLKPKKHIDISSTLHFCTMISAFIPTEFYDYRPAPLKLSGLYSGQGDLMKLPFKKNSVESLSCMHTIEHIGLGRYGDPIDPLGDLKAIAELKRVVKKGGTLLFVTPVGKPTLRFNAHRIYAYDQIIKYFSGFTLKEFALLPDNALEEGLIVPATKKQADAQSWGCGCFWFVKK